jgi:hypothetical protein
LAALIMVKQYHDITRKNLGTISGDARMSEQTPEFKWTDSKKDIYATDIYATATTLKAQLEDANKKLAASQSTKVDPTARAAAANNTRIVAAATDVVYYGLDSLSAFASRFETLVVNFNDLTSAIELKEKELEEVHGIVREATTLAALIDVHNQQKAEHAASISAADQEAADRRNAELERYNASLQYLRVDIAEAREAREQANKREREEWEYTFGIEKRDAKDAMEQELLKTRRDFDDECNERDKELTEREDACVELENINANLQAQVSAFQTTLDEAVTKAEGKAKDMAESKAETEAALVKAQTDGQLALLNAEIASLKSRLSDAEVRLQGANDAVAQAQSQVAQIANNTVNATAGMSKEEVRDLIAAGSSKK